MGNALDSIPPQLAAKYTQLEVQDITNEFSAIAGSSWGIKRHHISKAKFVKHFFKDNAELGERVFSYFDRDHSGSIDLNEFIVGMAFCCRGSDKDKFNLVFSLFDKDKNQQLDRVEFSSMITFVMDCITKATGATSTLSEKEKKHKVLEVVKCAFSSFDSDSDSQLSHSEFHKWASTSYELSLLLQQIHDIERIVFHLTVGNHLITHKQIEEETDVLCSNQEVPEDWQNLFDKAGVTKEELEQGSVKRFLVNVVAENAPPLPKRATPVTTAHHARSLPPPPTETVENESKEESSDGGDGLLDSSTPPPVPPRGSNAPPLLPIREFHHLDHSVHQLSTDEQAHVNSCLKHAIHNVRGRQTI